MGVFSFVRLNCTLNFVLASYNKNKNKNLTTSQKNQLKNQYVSIFFTSINSIIYQQTEIDHGIDVLS